ncbi:hypothetical protein [Tenacibaculum agarivorans]|uniref:hypothetical protein n=1 Tax=Tenacibaculum agarivorans TaxID=1908389 RepID=UPI00094B859C|nr:hypothetical protein [Tenacibaculum agarivorans]
MWKHFPIGILSLWAMGFSFFIYPKEVIKGYKKGLQYNGLIDQKISKATVMNHSIEELNTMLLKEKPAHFNLLNLSFWFLISTLFFLSPLLLLLTAFWLLV